jgi:phosphoglycolate phosphatase-like HAD superfamily hydrolase
MTKKLALFDLDLTLINESGGNLHLDSFDYAFKKVFNLDTDIRNEIDYSGKTDLGLIIEMCKKHEVAKETIQGNISEFINVMSSYFEKNICNVSIAPLPGSINLLKYLSSSADTMLGIVTGNCSSIANAKLKKLNMDEYFDNNLKGFGDIFERRIDIVRNVMLKATKYENKIAAFVFDDTPRGMEAAVGAGIKCIAVMTGKYKDKSSFSKYKPVLILNNLEEIEKIKNIFT